MAKGKNVFKQAYVFDGAVRPTKRWRQNGSVVHPLCIVQHEQPSPGDYVDIKPLTATILGTAEAAEAISFDLDVDGIPVPTSTNPGNCSFPFNYNGGADEIESRGHGGDAYDTVLAAFNLLPQDATGDSIYVIPAGVRVIFVSTSGDDATAGPSGNSTDHYTMATLPNPNNKDDPGAVNAYLNIDTAWDEVRTGTADACLLECGQIHYSTDFLSSKAGVSSTQFIYCSYYNSAGQTVARPKISNNDIVVGRGFSLGDSHIYFHGIDMHDTWRDPNHADFAYTTTDDGSGNDVFTPDVDGHNCFTFNGGVNVHFEDCIVQFGSILMAGAVTPTTISMRRCQFTDAYGDAARSQGIWMPEGFNIFVEECLIHRGGWWQKAVGGFEDDGQATGFNHDFYIENVNSCIIRNNFIIEPSSIGIKMTANPLDATDELADEKVWDIFIHDNVFIDCELAIEQRGNNLFNVSTRFRNCWTWGNTEHHMGRAQQTARTLGWQHLATDWNGGGIINNYGYSIGNATIDGVVTINLQNRIVNTRIDGNVQYGVGNAIGGFSTSAGMIRMSSDLLPTGVNITNNLLQSDGVKDGPCMVDHISGADVTYGGNRYYSPLTPTGSVFSIDGVQSTNAEWIAETGETGHTLDQITFNSTAVTSEDYMTSLGQTADLPTLVSKIKLQREGNRDLDYTALAYNAFVKRGLRPV